MTELQVKVLEIVLNQLENVNTNQSYLDVSDQILMHDVSDAARSHILHSLNMSNKKNVEAPLNESKDLIKALLKDAKLNPVKA